MQSSTVVSLTHTTRDVTSNSPVYKMQSRSVTSFDTKASDWKSVPRTADSWQPFEPLGTGAGESTVALTALSESPQREHKLAPTNTPPPRGPVPPPDGGLTAWLQVLGGYFLFWNTWGLINAFGVFQTFYSTTLMPHKSNSDIAWIGTLTSFLLCASPILWGPVFDLGSPRLLVFCGSFSVVFGIMMTSLCREYWQFMLAQGIVIGIGGGCLFITATSILPTYFTTKRALAMGIAASGSSCGGVLYPIIFTQLQPRIGFGWAVRVLAFIAMITLAVPCAVIKPRMRPPGRRKLIDTSMLKEIPYDIFNLATFFGFVGQYIPYFFIEQYAAEHGMSLGIYMLTFLNVGSIPGRILPSLVADKLRQPLHVLAACTGCATILAFCWIAIRHSTAGLLVWCLLYGFCSGEHIQLVNWSYTLADNFLFHL